jgi:putative methionine-R-sulfoxide reductase with GAF domain
MAMVSRSKQILPYWPFWYHPSTPLGSAVHYIASLSPQFNWVGIYLVKKQALQLACFMGPPTENEWIRARSPLVRSELVVTIRDINEKVLGQVDIDSYEENAFGEQEQNAVRQVTRELGRLWRK